MFERKKPMNPGKGFASRGGGFQSRGTKAAALAYEVGEGEGSTFGHSKRQQTRAAALCDEVGEGLALGFGISKKSQTRSAGKVHAQGGEVGEGVVRAFSKRAKGIEADYRASRERKMPTLADPSRFKWGEEVGEGVVSVVKTKARRSPAVMDSARGRMCMLQAPYTMHHDPATTVGCHGNGHQFGKAGARKADDCYVVWGCFECHAWLDQGSASAEEKAKVFHLGMFRQMLAWEQLAVSETEPERFRAAARWALECLEADEYDPRTELLELERAAIDAEPATHASTPAPALELDAQTGLYLPCVERQ